MAGSTVRITAADGGTFEGYLAVPSSGSGPGLILAQEIFGINRHMREIADLYAEEGYVVLAPDLFWRFAAGVELGYEGIDLETAFSFHERLGIDQSVHDINDAIRALRARPQCNGKVAVLGFGLGGRLAYLAAARLKVDAAVSYYGMELERHLEEVRSVHCPIVFHFGAEDGYTPPAVREAVRAAFAARDDAGIYVYPGADHGFNNPSRNNFNKSAATLAHSRTIGLLRRAIGPLYNLEELWEKHLEFEFATRSAEETMKTMVAEPYVNHVPNMTGGYGYSELLRFYKHHFIPSVPKDTKSFPFHGPSAMTPWWTSLFFVSPTTSRWTSCYPASPPPVSIWKSRMWQWSIFAATRSPTNISIGSRRPRWFSLDCWIPRACPLPALRPRKRCSTRAFPRTR